MVVLFELVSVHVLFPPDGLVPDNELSTTLQQGRAFLYFYPDLEFKYGLVRPEAKGILCRWVMGSCVSVWLQAKPSA